MKKYLLVLFVLSLLFVFSGSVVSAQTDSVSPEYSYQAPASVKSVSLWDKVNLFFTFNREKKVKLLQEFSGRNFETAKEKISQQKPEKAKVLLEKADKDIKKAADVVSKFENKEKQQEALSNISTITSNRTETLSRVLEQVKNPVAQQAITNAIKKQLETKSDVDQKINVLVNKIAELKAEIKQLEQEKTEIQEKEPPVLTVPISASDEEKEPPVLTVPILVPVSVPPAKNCTLTASFSAMPFFAMIGIDTSANTRVHLTSGNCNVRVDEFKVAGSAINQNSYFQNVKILDFSTNQYPPPQLGQTVSSFVAYADFYPIDFVIPINSTKDILIASGILSGAPAVMQPCLISATAVNLQTGDNISVTGLPVCVYNGAPK